MSEIVTIRQAQGHDIGYLALLFDLYRQFYGRASALAAAEAFLTERLVQTESVILVAQLTSQEQPLVGFVQLYPTFSSLSLRSYWILSDLFVDPKQRGQQIGRQLMLSAYEFARQSGAVGLSLQTRKSNTVAQKLYESLGWRKDEQFFSYDRRIE